MFVEPESYGCEAARQCGCIFERHGWWNFERKIAFHDDVVGECASGRIAIVRYFQISMLLSDFKFTHIEGNKILKEASIYLHERIQQRDLLSGSS